MAEATARGSHPLRGALWLTLAVVLALSVLVLNGTPLYYFDTAGYKLQGDTILQAIWPSALPTAGDGGAGAAAADPDNQISVARSAIYGLVVATSWIPGTPLGTVALQLIAVLITAAFVARVLARSTFGTSAELTLWAAPLAVAALTSLPFYVAYIMPDIFAALAILTMAVVVAFARSMTRWDLLLALAILGFAVVVHRSHLVIVGLAVPVALLAVLFTDRRRWWMAPGLIAFAALTGVAELKTYSVAAEKATGKVASITPFLTARIIADGPGYAYLLEHCPNEAIPTCILADALAQSTHPERLDPSNIVFERSAELGSYKHLSQDEQIKVARDQRRFYVSVFLDRPVETSLAIVRNTLVQASLTGIHMTVPNDASVAMLQRTLSPDLDVGRLSEDRSWIRATNAAHRVIYAASLALIVFLMVVPGLMTRELRVFAGFVLVGILINAFVCGAVSQPAARYGARVIWLLPMLACLLSLAAIRLKRENEASR